eukprot:TRINITY_DN1556_c0_g1_i1.p1 TRINITY_DN1556_c0_g1~~TRINITY_DN1556_c0_g1_i1.p1  ORF type:complete len:178 (-),score=51.16 TRINITY_DN1556_c0_g1_i1:233-766(-)
MSSSTQNQNSNTRNWLIFGVAAAVSSIGAYVIYKMARKKDKKEEAKVVFEQANKFLRSIEATKNVSKASSSKAHSLFSMIDKNHDGNIDKSELSAHLKKMVRDFQVFSPNLKLRLPDGKFTENVDEAVEAHFSKYDKDLSGALDEKEFVQYCEVLLTDIFVNTPTATTTTATEAKKI